MVRFYKKKTNRGECSSDAMKKAVDEVLNKRLGFKTASQVYKIPQTTLERYVKKIKQGNEIDFKSKLGTFTTVFTVQEEKNGLLFQAHGGTSLWPNYPGIEETCIPASCKK